jgi:ubiquinone/menaquinone biosynthesis C-methylase UbiE
MSIPKKIRMSMNSNKREIRDRYNQLGEKIYDLRYREEQSKKYYVALSEIKILENEIFLDHGCGTGLFMDILENPIVGIDSSNNLLQGALRKLSNTEKKYLVQGDVEYLPFRSRTFSKIFSFTVIQNLEEPLEVLKEISRVSIGIKIITTLKKVYDKDSLLSLIQKSGLTVVKIIENRNSNDWIILTM